VMIEDDRPIAATANSAIMITGIAEIASRIRPQKCGQK
jgi:hypothetical protein